MASASIAGLTGQPLSVPAERRPYDGTGAQFAPRLLRVVPSGRASALTVVARIVLVDLTRQSSDQPGQRVGQTGVDLRMIGQPQVFRDLGIFGELGFGLHNGFHACCCGCADLTIQAPSGSVDGPPKALEMRHFT
jgi:hypothetical protein